MSFRDFVSTQRPEALETEAVDAPQKPAAPPAASTALAKLPAARKTSSFHSFAAQRSQRAAPASTWMQSAWADEPELDEETRKLKHRQLVIVPEPPPPPRRVFARVAAEAAGLYATVDAEVAVAALPEGAPVGRVEGGQPSGGRAARRRRRASRPRSEGPALLEALGRGAPAAETALRLEHGAGRPDLAPAWQKGFVDVSPARVLVFGDGSVLDVAANARDASRPEILLEGSVLDYLTGAAAAVFREEGAQPIEFLGDGRTRHHPEAVKHAFAEAAREAPPEPTDAAKAEEGRIAEAGIEEAEE
ncbi:hypothetical protein JL720_10785 [Aureococcus anophagefferens]|nr:hypothetical protein JL720_10785 [Aureococcus anophagefferens]